MIFELLKAFFKSMISFDSHYHPFKYCHYLHFTNEETDAQRMVMYWVSRSAFDSQHERSQSRLRLLIAPSHQHRFGAHESFLSMLFTAQLKKPSAALVHQQFPH